MQPKIEKKPGYLGLWEVKGTQASCFHDVIGRGPGRGHWELLGNTGENLAKSENLEYLPEVTPFFWAEAQHELPPQTTAGTSGFRACLLR